MTQATCKAGRTEAGYTYVTMLVALMAMALAAQVTFVPTSTDLRRAAEAELIFRGQAYARALTSYYEADPAAPAWPESLGDLLDDPRAQDRRHIRRLYTPGLKGAEWETIPAASGGIIGVSVRLDQPPFRQAQLPKGVTLEQSVDDGAVLSFSHEP